MDNQESLGLAKTIADFIEVKLKRSSENTVRLVTRLELLTQLHNEQLDQLIRNEVDNQFVDVAIILAPDNKESVQRKKNIIGTIESKKKILKIVEDMIKREIKEFDKNG